MKHRENFTLPFVYGFISKKTDLFNISQYLEAMERCGPNLIEALNEIRGNFQLSEFLRAYFMTLFQVLNIFSAAEFICGS
jgi:hypothetical protein